MQMSIFLFFDLLTMFKHWCIIFCQFVENEWLSERMNDEFDELNLAENRSFSKTQKLSISVVA